MINVELKVEHFYLIAYLLFRDEASTSFSTLEKIKLACANKLDTELTSIEVDTDFFIRMFTILGGESEAQFSKPNKEMDDLLVPQIEAGVIAGNEDWITLATQVQAIRVSNRNNVLAYIEHAKQKLN
jgi:extradiol dioxygenase family protein